MKTTTLGRTGLHVSRVAFGTWQLGGDWGPFDESAAITAIRRARECGVNFFDTAPAYGSGAPEQILGRALRDELRSERDELAIAAKGGLRPADSSLVREASAEWLCRGVDLYLEEIDTIMANASPVAGPSPEGM